MTRGSRDSPGMQYQSSLPTNARRARARFALIGAAFFALSICTLLACRGKQEGADKGATGEPGQAAVTTCAAVGEKLTQLTMPRLDGSSERQKKLLLAQQHLIEEKAVASCDEDKWPAEVRSCMVGAADLDAFNQCTAPLRRAKGLPPPASQPPAVPAQPSPNPGAP